MSIQSRFWDKVEKTDGCWRWLASKNKGGYGQLSGYIAHRVSYTIHYGAIPKGMIVCHKCDNPECTNPEHLFVGTYKDNWDDAISKGRATQSYKKGFDSRRGEGVKFKKGNHFGLVD